MKHTILEKFLPRIALVVLFFIFTSLAISLALNYSTYSKFKIINTIFSCGIYIFFIYSIINRNKPSNRIKLKILIRKRIKRYGENCDLNDIDISKVTDIHALFFNINFNGDISNWDVSNVEDMQFMFSESKFNGDISKWNVSKVEKMGLMFHEAEFEGDLENWNVVNVKDIHGMFFKSKFNDNSSVDNDESLLEPPYWYSIEDKDQRMISVTNHLLHKDLVQNLKNDKKKEKKLKI